MNEDEGTRSETKHLFDDRKNGRRLLRFFVAGCALLLLADLVIHRHVVNAIESVFGFYAFFGFAASVVIVLLAREWRKVVARSEDYYDSMGK